MRFVNYNRLKIRWLRGGATLFILIFMVVGYFGCTEEKLPSDLPPTTGTVTIAVGAI